MKVSHIYSPQNILQVQRQFSVYRTLWVMMFEQCFTSVTWSVWIVCFTQIPLEQEKFLPRSYGRVIPCYFRIVMYISWTERELLLDLLEHWTWSMFIIRLRIVTLFLQGPTSHWKTWRLWTWKGHLPPCQNLITWLSRTQTSPYISNAIFLLTITNWNKEVNRHKTTTWFLVTSASFRCKCFHDQMRQ